MIIRFYKKKPGQTLFSSNFEFKFLYQKKNLKKSMSSDFTLWSPTMFSNFKESQCVFIIQFVFKVYTSLILWKVRSRNQPGFRNNKNHPVIWCYHLWWNDKYINIVGKSNICIFLSGENCGCIMDFCLGGNKKSTNF